VDETERSPWWKYAIAIVGPWILFVPLALVLAAFLVVFNFGWQYVGVDQQNGYVYSMAIMTVLLTVLYLLTRGSQHTRALSVLPIFSFVMLALFSSALYGYSQILVFRIIAIILLVALWAYMSWVIWRIFDEV